MIFETLTTKHVNLLFQFELENRAWFESLITARADDFYSESAVKAHIDHCIREEKLGKNYSGLLINNGVIVARANLKDINKQDHTCAVGYRVAKNAIGNGYASFCLSELIEKAQVLYSVKLLKAQVLDNNPASKKVLTKLGFQAFEHKVNFIELNGKKLNCTSYHLVL